MPVEGVDEIRLQHGIDLVGKAYVLEQVEILAHKRSHALPAFGTRHRAEQVPSAGIDSRRGVRIEKRGLVKHRLSDRVEVPAIELRAVRSEEHTSELQSLRHLVCR